MLHGHERRQEGGGAGELGDDPATRPAVLVAAEQCEDEQEEAAVSVTWPGQSSRRAFGSRDSRTQRAVMAMPATPSGTFTKNTASQPSPVVSAPPTAGPTANEAPIVAP